MAIPCWEAINCTRLFPIGSDYLHMTIPCWEWLSAHDYSLLGCNYLRMTIPCWDVIVCTALMAIVRYVYTSRFLGREGRSETRIIVMPFWWSLCTRHEWSPRLLERDCFPVGLINECPYGCCTLCTIRRVESMAAGARLNCSVKNYCNALLAITVRTDTSGVHGYWSTTELFC